MEVARPSILKNVSKSTRFSDMASSSPNGVQLTTGDAICWRSIHSKNDCDVMSSFKTQQNIVCQEPLTQVKACQGQDSDVDSGIVGCGKGGQRVGSTSSTDTDSSQDSGQKSDYCNPALRPDQIPKIGGLHFRTSKRNSCLAPQGGPVKGDHSVLKECNRRPPTPLTVFAEPNHCVRFDEHLQLSEQSIRRSCRKLFATLYAQRFSYPSIHSPIEPPSGPPPAPSTNLQSCVGQRSRSSTLPESVLKNQSSAIYNSRSTKSPKSDTDKENITSGTLRKGVSWNLTAQRKLDQMTLMNEKNLKNVCVAPTSMQKNIHQLSLECPSSLKASTDSGLGECRRKCKCSPQSSGGYSSQSSTSSNSSSHCYCCSSEYSQVQPILKIPTISKSNSCSTISNMLASATLHPVNLPSTLAKPSKDQMGTIPLQKTSSCSNIVSKDRNGPVASVPIYNDTMVHVYAQVASVVPDDSSRNPQSVTPTSGNTYDYVKFPLPTYPVPKNRSSAVAFRAYRTPTMYETIKGDMQRNCRTSYSSSNETKDNRSESSRVPTPSELYSPMESRLVPYQRRSRQESPYTTMVATVRPTAFMNSSSEPQLKSVLKPPRIGITQNGYVTSLDSHSQRDGSITTISSEAEYAMVDKTKKNRFSSLPTLNRFSSNSCIVDDEKDRPPVPPKKNLHKSEMNLCRSRSSSPKKSFLEKVNGLTKSARTVFQKAFSTERIYRPEREERLEAASQNFNRSKSFIKGIRASIVKKRKKNKPPLAEVVPQSSYNPLWDEQSGCDTPIHVRGQLLQLNLDGSQVVELSKPHNKPYGFFVARGRVRNSRGVFVSRMRDQETQKQLSGLLDIGDEILEIEGFGIKDADIMKVNELMANKNTLLLTVLPYICRKDI